MGAAVEALLFAGDGYEDDGAGEFEFREDAGGFEGDGDTRWASSLAPGAGSWVFEFRVLRSRSGR